MQYEIMVQIMVAMEATNFGNSVTKAKNMLLSMKLCATVLTKVGVLITNVNKLSLSELSEAEDCPSFSRSN